MRTIKGKRLPKAVMVLAVLALASTLVAVRHAEAAFPGQNGKIVFSSTRTTGTGIDNPTGDHEIFTMNPDGTGSPSSPITPATKTTPPSRPMARKSSLIAIRTGTTRSTS